MIFLAKEKIRGYVHFTVLVRCSPPRSSMRVYTPYTMAQCALS